MSSAHTANQLQFWVNQSMSELWFLWNAGLCGIRFPEDCNLYNMFIMIQGVPFIASLTVTNVMVYPGRWRLSVWLSFCVQRHGKRDAL